MALLEQLYGTTPVEPESAPTPPRPGESQLDATRRVLAESGMNASALAAINAANPWIAAQTGNR
jgi:hypothetical protein